MRSDKYKNEKFRSNQTDDRWEETQLVFQNRDKFREDAQRQRELEERRLREERYREYLAMRENPNGNRSPEEDDRYRNLRSDKVQKKKPVLETGEDREERRERRRQNRRSSNTRKKRSEETPKQPKRKKRSGDGGGIKTGSKKKLMIALIAVVAVLVVAFASLTVVLGKVGNLDIDKSNLGIDPQVKKDLKGYKNIALLGVDARDMDDYENCRTDAIIIISIDKKSNEIRQISVYRDTYVHVNDEYGYDKITNIHAYAGTTATIHALNENLDLNISDVVVVNWKAVAEGIDAIGGIEVDIQESEISEMNKYIINTANSIGGPKDLIEAPGVQTLNGVQAVTYARIRKDAATGDYRRNERMKIVVSAAIDKVKKRPWTINKAASSALPHVRTNMSTPELMSVMVSFMKNDMTGSTGWPFNTSGWTAYNGAWCGVPVTLSSNVIELHEEYFGQENYVPTETVQNISAEISARTGKY